MGQELLSVMGEMILLHEKLIVRSKQKQEALLERDVKRLTEVINKEKDLLQELRVSEEKRQQITEKLAGRTDQTLKEVLGMLSPPVKRMVENRAADLKEKAVKLQHMNDLNEELLRDGMAFVHHMIGHLTTTNQSITYGRPNQKPLQTPRGYFDTKA
ncbi:flagellar protein FlgN [Pseudalkalibacillus hwajinpoensis]|uniref:flagellar protein FlgN n=1 Tax=Guptibacillus hwajinpoensis TaxID=208199 RepID=UPI001CFF4EFA|nr:flagellar protein FlgN [Pseudalkalibacillus hwajinpoensis]